MAATPTSESTQNAGKACFIPLPGEGLISLRGAGIPAFLQGQLTCDTRGLAPERFLRGAQCDPKGRVLTDLLLYLVQPETCLLVLRADSVTDTANSLGLYARFSKIACDPADDWTLLGILGEDVPQRLHALGCDVPETPLTVTTTPLGILGRVGSARWQLLVPRAEHETVLGRLATEMMAAGEASWRAAELRDGLYRIAAEDRGVFTPQALNYDRLDLVSFKKGCYTGQEVVARLHYRGQSKRRLAVFSVADMPADCARGAQIEDAEGNAWGSLLRCEADSNGDLVLAAELKVDAPQQALFLNGRALTCVSPAPGAAD